VLVTDLVLNAGDARVGPTVLRIDGASLSLATLFPGLPAREAFSRLLAHLLQQGAQALPDRDSLERGAFRTFPSIAALDAAVWGPR
jgi:hypothetical protein